MQGPKLDKPLPPLKDSFVEEKEPEQEAAVATHEEKAQTPSQESTTEEASNNSETKEQNREFKEKILDTYLSLGNEEDGLLEMDLISYRQQGSEERFFTVRVNGWEKDDKSSAAWMKLSTKQQFDTLKTFFANLNWED